MFLRYLDECFASIVRQTYAGPIEVSLYDDGSEVRPSLPPAHKR